MSENTLLLCSVVPHNWCSTPQMKWLNGSRDYNSSVNTLIIIQCCFHGFYRVAKVDLHYFNRNLRSVYTKLQVDSVCLVWPDEACR